MKLVLWILGISAVLNVAADIWFRIAASTTMHAPWYGRRWLGRRLMPTKGSPR